MMLQATLHGHSDYIIDIKASPDGHHIVSTGNDGRAIIWDLHQARLLDRLN